MESPAYSNFIIPIFPSSKLLLKKNGREVIRIVKFGNGKKSADDNRVPAELLRKLLRESQWG